MTRREKQLVSKIERRLAEIRGHIWTERHPITQTAMAETMDHLSLAQAKKLHFKPMEKATAWGCPWGTAWFHITATVPKAFRGKTVSLYFETQGECLIYHRGKPVQGLDENRSDYILFDRAKGGERVELYVEAGANNAFGMYGDRTAQLPTLAIFNQEVFHAFWDGRCLYEMIMEGSLPQDDPWRAQIIFDLNKAVDQFDYRDGSQEALLASARAMRHQLERVYAHKATDSAQIAACMGHAHIDVAWLWPLAETVRKCGRTFSNVLSLMERYPEFVFCQSQPHLYEYARDRYPTLYKRTKERIKEGRWIPVGCTWVEMDCNVTGSESLARQILYAMRFFKQEFNHTPETMWLPDVFGYNASMPQLMKLAGIDNFLTAKISWSEYTNFPYHSFYWEGIDGSQVLTHLPYTYGATQRGKQVLTGTRNYKEKDRSPIHASLYGYSDGGGGPSKEMLERMNRYGDLEGMPKMRSMSPARFFKELKQTSRDLPKWVGELYLEFHRGTYTTHGWTKRNNTTHGWTKRNNRKAEMLLRDTEWLSALAMLAGSAYQQDRLEKAWKLVLLNQFHDIIPGSSITKVYEDADRDYAIAFEETHAVRDAALADLTAQIDTRGTGKAVVAHNALSWPTAGTVSISATGFKKDKTYVATAADGGTSPVQKGDDGRLYFMVAAPAMGHTVVHLTPGNHVDPLFDASEQVMENDYLRVRFDKTGQLTSLYDKAAGRETIEAGRVANQFQLFEDKTICGEAWDIDIYYKDKMLEVGGELISSRVVEHGPVRTVLRQERRISASTITQDIVLNAGSRRLEFDTRVDWGDENRVLLKVAFPVAVRSDKARYEIQYGSLERPTHWNMPQDFAKFEVCAQRWADLSEPDYGVALLNDCKYGHDIFDNIMRLTLLRATKYPDPVADINKQHRFCYALYPHTGPFTNGVVHQGYELNAPLGATPVKASAGSIPSWHSVFSLTDSGVIIDCVKKAEDDSGVVIRLYEAHGCRATVTLSTGLPVESVEEVNLLEENGKPRAIKDGRVRLSFNPYQIRTLKLKNNES
jgi:alpha-mannosidase